MKSLKNTFATTCLVIGTLLAPIVAHAADMDTERKQAVTFVKDSVITTKVKAKLAEEKMASLIHVTVNTDAKGMVFLSGNVKTQHDADKAVAIARATEGVTSVTSELKIKKN